MFPLRSAAGLLTFLIATAAIGHPPVSVVVDRDGNAYYSDLKHVWKLAPDGTKSIVVRGVHTHELYLDAKGNLFGENLWYEGDATKKWGYFFWRRGPDGKVVAITERREGFPSELSFVRDAAGNMYMADSTRKKLVKKAPNGASTVVASGFGDIRWMTVSRSGTVYLVDGLDVVRVRNSAVDRIAKQVTRTSLLRPQISKQHALMGLWLDAHENVYVADAAQGEVKRITAKGVVSTFVASSAPWMPTGGTFAANGDLLLLESSLTNQIRVRRIRLR